jgi:anion-transporting  ArsA/GET3 family ATPase
VQRGFLPTPRDLGDHPLKSHRGPLKQFFSPTRSPNLISFHEPRSGDTPAGHASALSGTILGLEVSRIDPVAETRAYMAEVLTEAGKDLDEKGRALLEEDLRSPCTEEIAVFRAFARKVDPGNHGFVVIDTAPTRHTLLLLDAANAYHRDVERNLSYIPDSVRRLLPQLRDPDFTKILIVTLPEATPVHEAARLQDDLKRAKITPYAWIINQSFYAAGTAVGLAYPLEAARQKRLLRCWGPDVIVCRSSFIRRHYLYQTQAPATTMLRIKA